MSAAEYRRFRSVAIAHIAMLRQFIGADRFGKLSAQTALQTARVNLAHLRGTYYGALRAKATHSGSVSAADWRRRFGGS